MVRILRNSRMDSVKRAAIFFIAFPPSTDIGPQKEIMELSSAAARCGLYTASRTGFSSNRQLSVLPALNAYKPTLHVLFFCFVSHYSSAACNIQFIFQENLSWSAQLSNNRMHALRAFYCHEKRNVPWHILAEHFYRMETKFPIRQKRVSRVNAAVYDRPWHSFPYGFDDKQGEMASCGISAPVI